MSKRIILASASVLRKRLLAGLGIDFEVIPANIDEKAIRHEHPGIQAQMIALGKAEKVASEHSGIVISADTFCEMNGKILEKPKDLDEARQMLQMQSGKEVNQYTGFCYLDTFAKIQVNEFFKTTTKFRDLFDDEIEAYLQSYPVLNWAAAFDPGEGYCMSMIEHVSGPYCAYLSLPIDRLVSLLKDSGINTYPKYTPS